MGLSHHRPTPIHPDRDVHVLAPSARRRAILAAAGLVAAIALVYGNSVGAPFLFDDAGAVLHNPTLRARNPLVWLSPPADGSTTTGRPLVNVTYALNFAVS